MKEILKCVNFITDEIYLTKIFVKFGKISNKEVRLGMGYHKTAIGIVIKNKVSELY